ncbi:hypothetical protein LINGRAHAP2_LOCUS14715 [Linum grandiflorum]
MAKTKKQRLSQQEQEAKSTPKKTPHSKNQTSSSRGKLILNKGNSSKKLNLGLEEEHPRAKKSKATEALVSVEETKGEKTNYPVVVLGLPIDRPLLKKRNKTEHTHVVVAVDDENDTDKVNEADVVMAEGKNDVNAADGGHDHNNADVVMAEDDNDNRRSDKEKGKEAVGIMDTNDANVAAAEDEKVNESDEKHTLWQKYPCVLASMKGKLSFMNENVSDFSGLCQDIMEKADQGKLKDWESRWRNQNKVQLETFAAKKTLENEQMKQWLDILQG